MVDVAVVRTISRSLYRENCWFELGWVGLGRVALIVRELWVDSVTVMPQ